MILEIEDRAERNKYIAEKRAEYMDNINVWRRASEMYVDHGVLGGERRDELIERFEIHGSGKSPDDRVSRRRNFVSRG